MKITIVPPVVKDPISGEYTNYQIPPAEYHTVCEMINRCSQWGGKREETQAVISMDTPSDVGEVHHTIVIYRGEPCFENRQFVLGALRRSWNAKLEFHS